MSQSYGNFFERKPPQKSAPIFAEPPRKANGSALASAENRPTYTKVFRWRLPEGQTREPATVEVVGSFTHWQKVPLVRDGALDAWHATIHQIEGHRTHHYMVLVDGKPAYDRTAEGLAVPHGPQEEQYQLITPRGPRLFMFFAQSK
jgi:hypothetical protein